MTPNYLETETPDRLRLRREPGLLILRGVLSVIFGFIAFTLPGAALLTIAFLFGIYAFVDGACALMSGVRLKKTQQPWVLSVAEGILGIIVGWVTLFWPGITVYVLSVLVGVWALSTGLLEIYGAFRLPRLLVGSASKILLAVAGLISTILGLSIFVQPLIGSVALVTLVASYAIIFGGLFIGLGVQMRKSRIEARPTIVEKGERAA